MNKKLRFFLLILLSAGASFVCFYATNLILSDIANMFYMTLTRDLISSLPVFLFAVELLIAVLAIVRGGRAPQERRALARRCALACAVLSAAGAACAVLTGSVIYGSFTAPYPFAGATLLLLAVHTAVLAAAVIALCVLRGEKGRVSAIRVLLWPLLAIYTYYAFDRFGAVLWAPVYAQASTLYKTFVFYLALLLPICVLLCAWRRALGFGCSRLAVRALLPLLAVGLNAAVILIGQKDMQFVAAISPALGIERLLSMPILAIAHTALSVIPALALLFGRRRRSGGGI